MARDAQADLKWSGRYAGSICSWISTWTHANDDCSAINYLRRANHHRTKFIFRRLIIAIPQALEPEGVDANTSNRTVHLLSRDEAGDRYLRKWEANEQAMFVPCVAHGDA